MDQLRCRPVAVFYDEIDAHVGGRAAVALACMLAHQANTNQVIAITHSPSVAAIADLHLVVQQAKGDVEANVDSLPGVPVVVQPADDILRREELARMASGDLASEEAQAFASALIREGSIRRLSKQMALAQSVQN
jgi:DNA repair protein RecN (Recombination protein N)